MWFWLFTSYTCIGSELTRAVQWFHFCFYLNYIFILVFPYIFSKLTSWYSLFSLAYNIQYGPQEKVANFECLIQNYRQWIYPVRVVVSSLSKSMCENQKVTFQSLKKWLKDLWQDSKFIENIIYNQCRKERSASISMEFKWKCCLVDQ